MDTPRCSEIPNLLLSTDWKLKRNIECRIILNKLKIRTPEYETMEFCRSLRNLSVPIEPPPAPPVSTITDMHFKSEFVLDVLLNEILGKCEEKCKVCEEYVKQLRHHIIQAHSVHHNPNPSPHAQTVTVFKCDICSSIYSSPSMLIRHRNTHSNTLTVPCTNEPVRFEIPTNNRISISTSFDLSSVYRTNESESSVHPHQIVPVPPLNFEWNSLKQESSQSELEVSNPNPLGIPQHMNHLSTIQNNLKEECNDLEWEEDIQDPLFLRNLEDPSFVKYECIGITTQPEHQTVLTTHEKSSSDTPADSESFPVPSDLIRHKVTQSVQKPYKCDICGKCFGKSHHLSRHKLAHTGVRPHQCDVCEMSFRQSAHLTRHRLTHTGERPFHCDECGMRFARGSCLANHKLTHTGERSHECDVCGKCFGRSGHLTRHKLTHTGEKPFHCDVCEKSFIQSAHLTRHKLTHTGVTEETSFHCDECGQNIHGREEMSKHKLNHTWQSTRYLDSTFVNHLKENGESSEEEGCQEDPLFNLDVSS